MTMPSNDDERLISHFADLTVAWQQHREVINRSVGLLATEIFDQAKRVERQLADMQRALDGQIAQANRRSSDIRAAIDQQMIDMRTRLDVDDVDRKVRQQQLDMVLSHLSSEIRSVRRWQWLRVGIEVVTILIVLALFAGARWL